MQMLYAVVSVMSVPVLPTQQAAYHLQSRSRRRRLMQDRIPTFVLKFVMSRILEISSQHPINLAVRDSSACSSTEVKRQAGRSCFSCTIEAEVSVQIRRLHSVTIHDNSSTEILFRYTITSSAVVKDLEFFSILLSEGTGSGVNSPRYKCFLHVEPQQHSVVHRI
jgi:hypothetical protein